MLVAWICLATDLGAEEGLQYSNRHAQGPREILVSVFT